jgi:hypothetical protein
MNIIIHQETKIKKKPVYFLVALEKLNNFLPATLSIGAYLTSGFTISYKVSQTAIFSFISSVSHHTINIIQNIFIETDSTQKMVQLCLFNYVNPCSIP